MEWACGYSIPEGFSNLATDSSSYFNLTKMERPKGLAHHTLVKEQIDNSYFRKPSHNLKISTATIVLEYYNAI